MRPYLLWHEGALGDLLLTRLAVAALRLGLSAPLVLCARNEARQLFWEAGLVDQAVNTTSDPKALIAALHPKGIFLFGGPRLRAIFNDIKVTIYPLPTRPSGRTHLSLEQLWSICQILKKPSLWQNALRRGLVFEKHQGGNLLLLHPGSGGRYKCAPPQSVKKLASYLKDLGHEVGFILGPAEKDLWKFFSGETVVFCEDLAMALRMLRSARGFVGFDSGLSHLAAALGLSTMVIFGPTSWWNWCPFGQQIQVFYTTCPCLRAGQDPRNCTDPCLAKLPLDRLAYEIATFFNTTAKYPSSETKTSSPKKRLPSWVQGSTASEKPMVPLNPQEPLAWYRWLGVAAVEVE